MLIVGLTGGIASGKSTVSRMLQSEHSIPLIDLDVLAREVVEPGTPTLRALVSAFGSEILREDGSLDRPALGRIAFADESKRKTLNKITHAAIRRRMAVLLAQHWMRGARVVVVDTPLLVEAGLWKWCGEAVLVHCSREDQLRRMLKRDADKGLTEADAQSRLNAQWPLDKKRPYADVVLDNSQHDAKGGAAGAGSLRAQVAQMVQGWHAQTHGLLGTARWLLAWLVPPAGLLMGFFAARSRQARVQRRLKEAGEDGKTK